MTGSVSFKGGKELEQALAALGDSRAIRSAARAALREAAKPMQVMAQSLAPRDVGNLVESIKIATGKGDRGNDGDQVFVVLGIDANVQPARIKGKLRGKGTYRDPGVAGVSVIKEFGSEREAPEPFMRPAWDAHSAQTPDRIGKALGPAIETQARRLARRAAKAR